jgi:hypothetical protein
MKFYLRFVRYSSSYTILSWLVILGAGGGARVNHRIGWYLRVPPNPFCTLKCFYPRVDTLLVT